MLNRQLTFVSLSVSSLALGSLALASTGLTTPGAAPASAAAHLSLSPNIPSGGGGGGSPGISATRQHAIGWQSSNWSGYAETSAAPYTGIGGHWVVPTAGATSTRTYSAAWVGIDGFNNKKLIQTGTEQDYYSGSAHYSAWWTTSAQGFAEQPIAETVDPGDHITAQISETKNTTTWTISLSDTTQAWSFTKTLTYSGPRASAEWIMEAPGVNGVQSAITDYGTAVFDPGTIDVGASPALVSSESGELVNAKSRVMSIPSVPDRDADGFAVSYGAVAPAAPSS